MSAKKSRRRSEEGQRTVRAPTKEGNTNSVEEKNRFNRRKESPGVGEVSRVDAED